MAEEEQTKSKRRIRKVETVREQSEKSQQPQKTSRGRAVWHGFTAPLRFVGRGLRKVGQKLGKYKVFRVLGRTLWPYYFRNSWNELRQVTWPDGKLTRQLTVAVILFALVFGIIVALLDIGLDKLFKEVLLK